MAGTATPTVTLQTGPETGTKVADFTSPANLIRNTTRNYTFTPDSPVTLAPSTQYWVVMEEGTTAVNPRITLEEGEDDTPVDGATMGNAAYHRFKNETGDFRLYTVQDQVVALGVRGVRFNALATGTVVAAAPNVFRVPAVLSADLSGIADANGVTGIASTATYTWQRLDAHGTTLEAADIGTGSTYSLTDADAGKRFRVVVSFRDDDGYAEGPFTSAATAAITAAAETCAPTLTGGATLVWTGTVPIRAAPSSYGFMASESDSLSNPTFTVGSNTYTVDAVVARTDGRLFLSLDKALTTDDRTGLAFHACRAPLDLLSATHVASGFHYIWGNSGVNWSSHAERTVHLTEDSAKPTFVEARVNGTSLVITFNEELGTAGSLANSAFAGKKTPDGGSETDLTFSTTTAPSISGRTVTLTLASTSAVSATDEDVKISYTKPTTGTANKIVDVVSNEADSFTDEEVINELADQVPPELATTGAAVLAADGVTLTLTFNEPLKTTSVPDEDAFTVEATPAGGVEAEVDLASTTPVTVDGSTVVLKLAVAITHNDTDVKVSYETPTSGAVIEDTNANDAADITDQTVTNNSEAPRVSIEAIYDDATPVMAYPEFRVTRSIASTSALTVNIEFTQDEAYVHSTTTTVTIPANQTTQSQEVFISSSHQLTSGDFTATVAAGAGYAPAVTPDDSDTVAIKIPTPAIAGSAFPETAISVDEGESVDVQVDINIYPGAARPKRQNSISGVLFQAQTATISVDYTHISRSFSPSTSDWTASSDGGYTAMDIFTVQTVEDEVYEGDETFTVTFTAVPGAPSLHIPTGSGTLTITITDDDTLEVSDVEVSSTPTGGYYGATDTISITVTFNGKVTVTGTPQFAFDLAGATRQAAYASGSDSTELVFSYTVLATDPEDHDGISWGANALSLNSGTIKFMHSDVAEQVAADLDHDAQAALPGHKVDTVKPAFVEASVNGTSLTLTFSEALNTTAPANSDFAAKKTPAGTTTATDLTFSSTTPSISGRTVTLTLATASAVTATDTDVKVAYTKPGTNPIKDLSGKEADGFPFPNGKDVINRLADSVLPELATTDTAVVAADGVTLTVTFNEPLKTTSVPAASAFTVKATPARGSEDEVDLASGTPWPSSAARWC